ncbi:hypothetical protein [Coraliomargarita akajimensis]|uniref:Uncharacterized protein n=1 Tax=Coraliomargarita akajimensis (strain DSM 45221 / IAM 15411 / JCM 23193 / KCTC 12865 / 04OKA010-24) TaxID=583355 RepID=D5EJD8_CORAD|nr:hypothetical protein [Coraliomargarita akajimensis]ADE54537.1 hypothetical protein Caka_1518 [Coraliomargarita akajimensis DSM 45221]
MKLSLTTFNLLLTAISIALLSGCGAGNPESLEDEPRRATRTGGSSLGPHLVHVDQIRRIATLSRNSADLEGDFLIATTGSNNRQTGVLKQIPKKVSNASQTADILEGKPSVNDSVREATAEESAELEKLYRDVSN